MPDTPPRPTAVMPAMMYGTAWKKDRTADLVYEAIKAGFRGIDTAAMKRHYDEALVGEGIRRAIREGIVTRGDLFIQTKYTPLDDTFPMQHVEGEEGNLEDLIPSQIHQSITSSLNNLSTPSEPPYLDALILHSPFPTQAQTQLAWRCLQQYLPSSSSPDLAGKILRLGISNAPLGSITALDPAPSIVQNRFHAVERRWDTQVRAWCRARREFDRAEAYYQAFWTLTANPDVWRGPDAKWFVRELAQHAGVSPAAAWYVLLMDGAGLVVLNGTSNSTHMRDDLEARAKVAAWAATEEGREPWIRCVEGFKEMVWR